MHRFKDTLGREWGVRLTMAVERDVHSDAGVYLSDLSDNATLGRLETDPGLLGDVLWSLVRVQAEEIGVTQTSFLDAISGEVLEDAYEAVLEETLDFLGRRGQVIRKHRTERKRIEKELEEANLTEMGEVTGAQAFDMLQKLLGISTTSGGSVPESVELTPATSA